MIFVLSRKVAQDWNLGQEILSKDSSDSKGNRLNGIYGRAVETQPGNERAFSPHRSNGFPAYRLSYESSESLTGSHACTGDGNPYCRSGAKSVGLLHEAVSSRRVASLGSLTWRADHGVRRARRAALRCRKAVLQANGWRVPTNWLPHAPVAFVLQDGQSRPAALCQFGSNTSPNHQRTFGPCPAAGGAAYGACSRTFSGDIRIRSFSASQSS